MGALAYYYLFTNPSFLSGIARTLDIGGHYDAYNFSPTPEEADIKELSEDWRRVNEQLRIAWEKVACEDPDFARQLDEADESIRSHSLLPSIGLSKVEPDELKEEKPKA